MKKFLEFEEHLSDIENKIENLKNSTQKDANILNKISNLQKDFDSNLKKTYSSLSPWQKVLVARHSDRPHASDYLEGLLKNFIPLSGDRLFGEDSAIIGGIGRFKDFSILFIGQEKGRDTEEKVKRNFGMAKPEGYRKSIRLMKFAEHFQLPILTLVDTPGAYPGIGAEERGQAEAIARSIQTCLSIKVPLISIIIGEGGSGGAIALASANHVLMLEHSVYSVISPEGCASILWRDTNKAQDAAEAMRITAEDMLRLGIIDTIIPEPIGGAHRDKAQAIKNLGDSIEEKLKTLISLDGNEIMKRRREKFMKIGNNFL
ncbi:MAG: acetyl-CoA carboxylase carboxyltransferase subunit alpha [Alphaproteobacteria bacterium]|nr:acetyl-CoA carboxylase carboxyltransferase subunit alpha [Alphaproteobacteria bacterium]PPR39838.1 MAG: Acetyl-coenzyme A carboxylase carboxyl transferase subunit alpha [Alphaproteobacteria bacterium MarineAlpha7_Bin1]|tara:strand:- start:128 stop:1078 length:951 start_codon:yes stop_codon:yes gene_type:complete